MLEFKEDKTMEHTYIITFSTPYGVEEVDLVAETEQDARIIFVCEYPEYSP